MAVISEYYKQQLLDMHKSLGVTRQWGTTGARNFGDYIVRFLEKRKYVTVLDFGAGQLSLEAYVQREYRDYHTLEWTNYDPGVKGIDSTPIGQYDLIISSDVLEHVEPEQLDDVIEWLGAHVTKAQFHHIACDPCGLILPDGRNAHLITEKLDWWLDRFVTESWALMYSADCQVKKRQSLRRHCHIQLDHV